MTPGVAVLLPDPERCPKCKARGTVIKSVRVERRRRSADGALVTLRYRKRRHECRCGFRWNSFQSVIDPMRVVMKAGRA